MDRLLFLQLRFPQTDYMKSFLRDIGSLVVNTIIRFSWQEGVLAQS